MAMSLPDSGASKKFDFTVENQGKEYINVIAASRFERNYLARKS